VKAATERAILEATGLKGEVTCRFTHVYPDGPAQYFSFYVLGRHRALLEQWQAIKNAASDALIEAGGTITHHHAIGYGTIVSARGFSRPRFGQQKENSIHKACSTRECSSIRKADRRANGAWPEGVVE
jgi:hypothetical protein